MLHRNTNHTIGVTSGGTNDVRVLQHALSVPRSLQGSQARLSNCAGSFRTQSSAVSGGIRRNSVVLENEPGSDRMPIGTAGQPPVAAWASLIINKMLST